GDSCLLPVTQVELGDATGLSNVHVNRVLQELRASGLIVLRGKRLTIPDLEALQRIALFNVNYLHLEREGRRLEESQLIPG
ncbi:helix-turn-helix domain-containing protein, partial [Methylobacterium oxalidis]|uniref:helix-turn-helix domain-containing protein n=1 Tax=Methylobacterium oxalidis TaxID=944322 RepID=UPI0033148BD3